MDLLSRSCFWAGLLGFLTLERWSLGLLGLLGTVRDLREPGGRPGRRQTRIEGKSRHRAAGEGDCRKGGERAAERRDRDYLQRVEPVGRAGGGA